MKKGMLFFLSVLLLAALVFALSSCRDKEPPETTVGEYEITFIVGDSSLTVSVASGETPVYPNGTPKKAAVKSCLPTSFSIFILCMVMWESNAVPCG